MKSIFRIVVAILLGLAPYAAHADLEIGDTVPGVDTALVDGRRLAAGQLQGKVVLTVFWATWCHVCMRELPEYQKLYDAYKRRGLEIVAVSLDREPGEVVEFWRGSGYTFPIAMRSDDIRRNYGGITGTPTIFLIDRKGTLRYKHLGELPYRNLEKRVTELL